MHYSNRTSFSNRCTAVLVGIAMLLSAFPASFFSFNFANAFTNSISFDVDVVASPSGGNTEYVEVTNNTGEEYDMSNIEVHEESSGMFYQYSNVLAVGDSFRICADETLSSDCDAEWTGGDRLNNSGGETVSFRFQSNPSNVLGSVIVPDPAVTDEVYQGTFDITFAGNVRNVDTGEVFSTIQLALDDADTDAGDTLELDSDLTITEQITLDFPITLDGNGYTIDADFIKEDNGNNSAIGVQANDVTIQNLVLTASGDAPWPDQLHGVNAYEAENLTLHNLDISGFEGSGISINSSEVMASDITTSGNGWHGINVDQKTSNPSSLTISEASSHDEALQIYLDDISKDVSVDDVDDQYDYEEFPNLNDVSDEVANPRTAGLYTLRQDTVKPVLTVIEPMTNFLTNADFTITVAATDNEELEKMVVNVKDGDNSGHIGTCLNESVSGTAATSSCVVDISELPDGDGQYYFRANADDANGNKSNTISQPFTVDTGKPQVAISAPTWGDVVGSDVDVFGTATDTISTITEVKYRVTEVDAIGGSYVANVTSGVATGTENWTFDVTSLTSGFYRLKVQAFDEAGNHKYAYHDVEVDTTKPNVAIHTPANAETLYTGMIAATGTASDAQTSIAEVKYTVNEIDGLGGSYVSTGPSGVATGAENWNFTVELTNPGFYRFKVQAFDEDGNWRYKYHDVEVVPRPEASLQITSPETNGQSLVASHTFTAEYMDADDTEDTVYWAIRAGSCNGEDMAGNAPASPFHPSNFDAESGEFSTTVDMSGWESGDYCLVINPRESSGNDVRATRTFSLDNSSLTCELELLSNNATVVVDNNDYATSTYVHNNWTDDITDATWIWDSYYVTNPEVEETRTFRETFTIATPTAANLEVAADNGYVVYLNGMEVQDRSLPTYANNFADHTYEHGLDVTNYLQNGTNTLEIVVTNSGNEDENARGNPAGLLYKLTVTAEAVDGAPCAVTTAPTPETEMYTITGAKWEDTDGDGVWDEDESGKEGWTIYLDYFYGEVATTTSTTTDADGDYSFEVPAGYYEVYEEQREGWVQTAPTTTALAWLEDSNLDGYGSCTYWFGGETNEASFSVLTAEDSGFTQGPCNFGNQPTSSSSSVDDDNNDNNTVNNTPTGGGGDTTGTQLAAFNAPADAGSVLGASTANYCPYLTDYLRMGGENSAWEVVKLQLFLSMVMGYDNPITGTFGTITDQNVKVFQQTYGSEVLQPWVDAGLAPTDAPTGFVYKTTKWKINEIVCPGQKPFPNLTD